MKFFINMKYEMGYYGLKAVRVLLTVGYKVTCRARNTKLRGLYLKICMQWMAVTERIYWHLDKWDKALAEMEGRYNGRTG